LARPARLERATCGFEDLGGVKFSKFSNPLILVRFSRNSLEKYAKFSFFPFLPIPVYSNLFHSFLVDSITILAQYPRVNEKSYHIIADGTLSPCVFSPFGVAHLKEIESFSGFPEFSEGKKRFTNIQDALTNQETLRFYREQQKKIKDRFRPCVLIDHPEYARGIFRRNTALKPTIPLPIIFRGGPQVSSIKEQRSGKRSGPPN